MFVVVSSVDLVVGGGLWWWCQGVVWWVDGCGVVIFGGGGGGGSRWFGVVWCGRCGCWPWWLVVTRKERECEMMEWKREREVENRRGKWSVCLFQQGREGKGSSDVDYYLSTRYKPYVWSMYQVSIDRSRQDRVSEKEKGDGIG